jgi:hypothetical protein
MMQSAPGYLLDLRLYLEGIQVPVIGASVNASVGSAATANIEIIPHDSADLILPRTIVHLFYLDHVRFKKSGKSRPDGSDYNLLFCGEVFSVSQSKVGVGSRSVSLGCMDFSNVLDTTYIYSMNYTGGDTPENSIVSNSSRFLATLDSEFDNIINSPSEMIRQLAESMPSSSSSPISTSVLGGLLAIIERLLGVQGRTYGVNQWTTIHERQVRLLESIIADSGETAAQIFEATQFSEWLRGKIGSEGNVISFRRVVDIILNYIMYAMVPNPVAKYVPGLSLTKPTYPNRDVPEFSIPLATPTGDSSFEQFEASGAAKLLKLQKEFVDAVTPFLAKVDATLRQGVLNGGPAQVYITSAYRENKDDTLTAHERGLAIDIRFQYLDEKRVNSAKIIGSVDAPALGNVRMPFNTHMRGAGLVRIRELTSWYLRLRSAIYSLSLSSNGIISSLDQLRSGILANSGVFSDIYSSNKLLLESDILVAQDWQRFGAILSQAKTAQLDVLLMIGRGNNIDPLFDTILKIGNDPVHVQYANIPGVAPTTVESVRVSSGPSSPRERLHSFVLRPDVWFVSPPRSNVMFPDMIQAFSAQREMMRETSRLSLNIGFEFAENSAAVANTIFSPQINGRTSLVAEGLNSADQIIIYDHEKFTGVVPKFERMLDTMFFINKDGDPSESDKLSLYASKIAHFHLLNERYQARQASVSLTFSPHIICGFPGVVIDAVITAEEAGNPDFSLNRSFKIGMIQSVSHSISQAGAQTQVRMTHVRSHKTGDKTDDLFSTIINREGTLDIQDPTRLDQMVSSWGIFAPSGQKRVISQNNPEFDFGWAAIAAAFNESTIESLLSAAWLYDIQDVVESLSTEVDPETFPKAGTVLYRAVLNSESGVVSFRSTEYRGTRVNSGTWTGPAILVWIRTEVDTGGVAAPGVRDTDNTEISIGTTAPTEFKITLPVDADISLTRLYFSTGQTVVSYTPLVLPGSTFEVKLDRKVASTGKILPVEESIRPIWMSDAYGAERITSEIYDPFFGTRAIVDDVRTTKFSVKSVEEAVDQICITYAKQVARVDLTESGEISPDPLEWIYEYTRRDVASYPEILGSKEVRYNTTKEGVVRIEPAPSSPLPEDAKYYGGFHSNAVNFGRTDYGSELEFLDILNVGLVHTGHSGGDEPFVINKQDATKLDPRMERAERINNYVSAIDGRSALGVTSINGIGKRG